MPKKKKTREQKIQSERRRQTPVSTPQLRATEQSVPKADTAEPTPQIQQATFSLPKEYIVKKHPGIPKGLTQEETHAISTRSYKYLGPDLLKTLSLTGFIIVAELLIKFFFERG